MTKENYRAWDIDITAFPASGSMEDQLRFLIGFAILAPSGHNSQPWNFSIRKNEIDILVNEERSLAQSDPDRRQLLLTFGCVIENFLIAADYYGFHARVIYLPNVKNNNVITTINFKKTSKKKDNGKHLIFAIPRRHTNRNKYKEVLPTESFFEKIKDLSDDDILVTTITNKGIKALVADVVNAAQIEVMEEDLFREELSQYIKSNITKSKTGMPGFTLGLPLPVSLIASRLIRRVNMSKKTMKQDDELLKLHTPVFVIISTKQDNGVSRVKAGQVLEKIWLMATAEELSCAPLAAGTQVGNYYQDLQRILNLNFRPQIFFRMGHCDKKSFHSPRLAVEEVLV